MLSRPRNRFSLPPDIGSIASTGLDCAAIAVGSFSSPVDTQEPGVVTPMSARKVVRVPDPTCGMIGMMVLAEVPPTEVHVVSVQV